MNFGRPFLHRPGESPLSAHFRHTAAALLGVAAIWSTWTTPMRATAAPAAATLASVQAAALTARIPVRRADALTGSQFGETVRHLDGRQREHAVLQELLAGNVPSFLRKLAPVTLSAARGGGEQATIFVMPDYLAIGSDDDYLRIPMNLETATAVASAFDFVLPTRHIVDAVYAQSAHHFTPEPLTPGPQMSSTDYYLRHNQMIEAQARANGVVPGTLVSGHKKDVVITNLLARIPGRIAIYGWQRPGGTPIQPLSTVHGACYEDYSHGIRLVSDTAVEGGVQRSVRGLLQDPATAPVLSDEGAIRTFAQGVASSMLATFSPGFCSSGTRDGN